ncbi:MAG: oxaloacetate decarboxylase [Clostridia bacterium]|nr:oxaloacetate decarboxylase [Clostridia bacterium]
MFEPIQFINHLKYMGVGMLGVFIIIGIIIASTYAIGKWTAPARENDEK